MSVFLTGTFMAFALSGTFIAFDLSVFRGHHKSGRIILRLLKQDFFHIEFLYRFPASGVKAYFSVVVGVCSLCAVGT